MNAYELANELHKAVNNDEKHLTLDIEAMLMLRQQANRILELDVNLKAQIRLAYDQADRIAELEKENEKLKEYKWMYEGLCK